ncbi:hypothetical protein HPB48_018403 [Haemaphysalis longicornis]|uniref:Uncharacterized protein n=1 Tax=Haemaphysalis longicornis TaxID=44386 RepID=A0A9J6G4M5_HAELO|nr:hypothetical protein HPB48_018403 [Haemaphysalis longicornis]
MVSDHDVTILEQLNELRVTFYGSNGTPYRKGVSDVSVELFEQYTCEPPHAVKQAWKVSSDLRDLFDRLLSQLLAHPVPIGPLNSNAALPSSSWSREYDKKVREYVTMLATPEKLMEQRKTSSSGDSLGSSFSDSDSTTCAEEEPLEKNWCLSSPPPPSPRINWLRLFALLGRRPDKLIVVSCPDGNARLRERRAHVT